jgi:hypothetical protein
LWDFCPIEVTDLGQNTYVSITGSFLGANGENTAALADRRAKTYWLTLSLRNIGRKVARGVVVDVVVDADGGVGGRRPEPVRRRPPGARDAVLHAAGLAAA